MAILTLTPGMQGLRDTGIIVDATVYIDMPLPNSNQTAPLPPMGSQKAMIDTGAYYTAIENSLALKFGLQAIDKVRTFPIGQQGEVLCPAYLARLQIDGLNRMFDGPIIGMEMNDPQHPLLIGRNYLAILAMFYDGPGGRVTLCD